MFAQKGDSGAGVVQFQYCQERNSIRALNKRNAVLFSMLVCSTVFVSPLPIYIAHPDVPEVTSRSLCYQSEQTMSSHANSVIFCAVHRNFSARKNEIQDDWRQYGNL